MNGIAKSVAATVVKLVAIVLCTCLVTGSMGESLVSVAYADVASAAGESGGYTHSDSATSGSLVLTVEWNDPVLGEETAFHVSATGGSGSYKYYMAAPAYSSTGEWSFSSVPDPSRGEYTTYSDVCESKDFTFTMTASGTYFYKFYVMDMGEKPYKTLNSRTYVSVADDAHPSVAAIVSDAVSQAKAATDGGEYEIALWLHDWLLDQLEYDNSLTWVSTEAALTRHTGTCQAYTNAYIELLNAAGIENAETRDTYDGHTWNAVKLDDEWYQVDCTWDDNDDTKYYGFDARHLYFGLTDELMAVAHKGHASIYTADGYATRSTSLADNYYVRSDLAGTWADAYASRILNKLDAGETSFSLDSDNGYNPPSIIGIQNSVVAYAMSQKGWTTSDGSAVKLTATSNVTTESSTKWSAVYDFTAAYSDPEPTPDPEPAPDPEPTPDPTPTPDPDPEPSPAPTPDPDPEPSPAPTPEPTPTPDPGPEPVVWTFKDVSSSVAHSDDINWLASAGVSTGWAESDGTRTFRPYWNVARADMAAFLYRLAGSPNYTAPSTSPFKDVNPSIAHYKEICWLAEKGISQGWSVSGGREFRPYASVARCDMAAFLYRMAGSPSYTVSDSPFIDCSSKTPHYKEVCWLASTGVSAGWDVSGGKEFRSYTKVARADMAAFLHRMKNKGLVA